jgi:hypothetical protein
MKCPPHNYDEYDISKSFKKYIYKKYKERIIVKVKIFEK